MEFLGKFMKLVAKQLQNIDSPYDVFCFEYDPTKSDTVFMTKRPNEDAFLPEWFIQEMEKAAKEES